MSKKFYEFEKNKFIWNCPGCECLHHIQTNKSEMPYWNFNGNLEQPTVSPSVRVRGGKDYVCHFFIRDGKIEFLNDSTHKLSGQTVDVPDWENS